MILRTSSSVGNAAVAAGSTSYGTSSRAVGFLSMAGQGGIWSLFAAWMWLGSVALAAGNPVVLATEHVDLRIRYQPEATPMLEIVATNDDARPPVDHPATHCVLQAADFARLELPADLPPLGAAGDPIWVLPASQREGLLYLGMSAEGNPFGVFDGPLEIRLLGVDGPGHFFLWQAELGGLQFWMNSRDGLRPDDAFRQSVGGHSHFDWGFSTSGVYRLTFQAIARRLGETTNIVSDPTVFTFHILPLPPVSASPFEQWQASQWPGESDPSIIGDDADPDGDRLVNLWEYALGTSPRIPDPNPLPGPSMVLEGNAGQMKPAIRVPRVGSAVDIRYRVWATASINGPWVVRTMDMDTAPGAGETLVFTFRDAEPVAQHARLYYRVEAQRTNQP